MIRRSKRKKKLKFRPKRHCWFEENKVVPDYKHPEILGRFINERGKILPRRTTAVTACNQRKLAIAVKRARHLGLLPFVAENVHH